MSDSQVVKPKSVKYNYRFKHGRTVMELQRTDGGNFHVSETPSSLKNVTMSIVVLVAAVGAIYLIRPLSYLSHDMFFPAPDEQEHIYTPAILEGAVEFKNSFEQAWGSMISMTLAVLVAALLFGVVTGVLALCIYGKKTLGDWYFGETEEKVKVSFDPLALPYLHLLNPEVLYHYLKDQQRLNKYNSDAHDLFEDSKKLKSGFLKDEVEKKRRSLLDEYNKLQKDSSARFGAENHRLSDYGAEDASRVRREKYSKFENEVLKKLSA